MKKLAKILALMISLCMIFTMVAVGGESTEGQPMMEGESGDESGGESDEGPGGPGGGPGGSGGDSQMSMASDGAAATTIFSITGEGLTVDEAADYVLEGEVGETEADGISMEINTFTANGFKVNSGQYTIKNSHITANVTEPVDANAAGGFIAGVSDGLLVIDTCDFTTSGKGGRGGNYTLCCDNTGTMVVINSKIVQTGLTGDPEGYTIDIADPPSNEGLLISGYARANMSLGKSKTYYYGSYVETEGWAAMSTDSAQSGFAFYSYDSAAKGLKGGYGTYADTSCVDWFYASVLSGAEIGAIISNNGEIHMKNGDSADEAALEFLPEDYILSDGYKARGGRNYVEAGRNDFQIHSPDMMGQGAGSDFHAVLDLEDTDIVTDKTLDEEAVLVNWREDYGPAIGEYVDFIKGANILTKSTGAYITLKNVTAESYTGVLLLSALNSDSMSRYALADNDMTGKGPELTIIDCDIKGDVDHFDYQRNCVLTLNNSTWTGAYKTMDKAAWDALWSDECKADPKCYWILDEEKYFTGEGTTAALVMDAASVWNAEGESHFNSLTLEAGAVINGVVALDGKELDVTAGGSWTGDIMVLGEDAVLTADEAAELGLNDELPEGIN